MSLLEVRSLVKTYPGVRALDNVDFDLEAGQINALIGVNGAGKSTLVKIIAGAEQEDSGTIRLDGQPIEINRVSDAKEHGIVVVHQERTLVRHLSVAENIMLGAEPCTVGIVQKKSLLQQAKELVERLGVTGLDLNASIESLGAGKQQLVDIIRALRTSPKVLVLDEPTSALSSGEIQHLFEVLHRFKERGVGIIFISHHMNEVFEIADYVTILRNGKVVSAGPIEDYEPTQIPKLIVGQEVAETSGDYVDASQNPVLLETQTLRGEGFHDVSLKVHAGEVVALAGVVGAGRTELLESIVGYRVVEDGKILFKGQEQRIRSPQQAIRSGLVLVPDKRMEKGLMLRLSVLENLSVVNVKRFSPMGVVSDSKIKQASKNMVKQLSIATPNLTTNIGNLSGGNKQKVVFGKWLSAIETVEDKVFFFDEPTEGIDVGARAEMWNIIRDLAARGAGVVVSTSDMEELMAIADRICVMRGGEIVQIRNRDAFPQDVVMQYMLGATEVATA